MNSFYEMVEQQLNETKAIKNNLKPCVDIYKKYSYNINDFSKYNFSDYLTLIYTTTYIENVEKYTKIIEKYKDKLDRVDAHDLDRIIELYNSLTISYKSELSLLITSYNYEQRLEEFNKKPFNKDARILLNKILLDSNNKLDFDFYNILIKEFFNKTDKSLLIGIIEIYKIKYIKECTNEIKENAKKIANKAIRDKGNLGLKVLDLITKTKNRVEGEYNVFERAKIKQINLLTQLLNDIKKNEYIDIEQYRKLTEGNILLELLFYNSKFYNDDYELELERNNNINYNINKLEEFFLKENINIDIESINIDYEKVIDKIKVIINLKQLTKYNNVLLYIINNISLDNLKKIILFLNEKLYNEKFLLDNILNFDSETLNNFISNIELLRLNGININNIIKYDKNILFYNNKKITNLINIYKKYNINLKSDCYNFEWLKKDLSNIIDKFIEIKQYELIKNNLSLLNNKSNIIIKRCILYMNLNNEIINEQNKLKGNIRKEENFIINDQLLNETIITNYDLFIPSEIMEVLNLDYSNYENTYNLNKINDYMIDEHTYKFNDILISKNKVIRNLNLLYDYELNKKYSENNLLLFSIIYLYPKILLTSDIEYIKEIINKNIKVLKKQTK